MLVAESELLLFCKNVKLLRKNKKITQQRMAEIMEIGIKSLSKIERGEIPKRLGVSVVINLASHFNIEPYELFSSLEMKKR